jgi:flagellar biosynthetic protein FliQ
MNPEVAIDLFKTTLVFALYIVSPFLITVLVIGLASSLIQSVTSIQEQTLTFAPTLIGLSGLAHLLTPWLLRSLTEFASSTLARMATLAH